MDDDYELELDDEELENYDENIDHEMDDELDNFDDTDDDYENDQPAESQRDPFALSPEEAGFDDGAFDAQMGNPDYMSYGTSVDLDSLTDDERDNYEQSYLTGLDANRRH